MARKKNQVKAVESFEVAICDLKSEFKTVIEPRILTIRGVQVILDYDIASLYEVETKRLNEAVKRNIERFPSDFLFQLSKDEFEQLNASTFDDSLRSQFATSKGRGGTRYLPYAFSELGVSMLSSVLKSSKAIKANIMIMRAFVAMRQLVSPNTQVMQRLETIEYHQLKLQEHIEGNDRKIEEVLDKLEQTETKPIEGIFYDGQIYDAHVFVCDLIKNAEHRIILIDNYIDETVLTRLVYRKSDVAVTIYTQRITKELKLELDNHNAQYPGVEIQISNKAHDRFMITDDTVYHLGASIKDLGKKIFAFSKMNESPDNLLSHFV